MRLIDKQKALDALMAERKYLIARGQEGVEHVLTHHAYNVIDDQPIVESRPKGKWLYHRASNGLVVVKCSECKKTYGFLKTNYCPHCGADMRGDDHE